MKKRKKITALLLSLVMIVSMVRMETGDAKAAGSFDMANTTATVTPATPAPSIQMTYTDSTDAADHVELAASKVIERGGHKYVTLTLSNALKNDVLMSDYYENSNFDPSFVCTYTIAPAEGAAILVAGNHITGNLNSGNPKITGTYDVVKNADTSLTVTMNISVGGDEDTTLRDVVGGCGFELQLDDNAKADEFPTFSCDGTNRITMGYAMQAWEADDDYQLEKSAVLSDDEITYTITTSVSGQAVEGTDVVLNGFVFKDDVPADLAITEATVNYYAESDSASPINGSPIDVAPASGNLIQYVIPATIPDGGTGATAKKAVYTIKTKLTNAAYQKYIATGQALSDITNKAGLFADEAKANAGTDADALATGSATTAAADFFGEKAFITKEGNQLGKNGKVYRWNLTTQTRFASGTDVYIVDHILDASQHTYLINTTNPLKVTYHDGTIVTYDETQVSTDVKSITYDGITSGATLRSIDKPTYYQYTDNGKTEQILIIPLDTTKLDGTVTITYDTKVKELTTADGNITLSNAAKMAWSQVSNGTGAPGISYVDCGISPIDKTFDYSVLKKTKTDAVDYDPVNGTMSWDIKINDNGSALENLVLTDDLNEITGAQALAHSGGMAYTQAITIKKITNGNEGDAVDVTSEFTKVTEATDTAKRYWFSDSDKLLTVNFGDVAATECYIVTVQTKITDPSLVAVQQSTAQRANRSYIAFGPSGTRNTIHTDARQTYKNTWLTKSKVSSAYNYHKH